MAATTEEETATRHMSEFANHGERVVVGQRLMQATSDIFLGWLHVDAGLDGKPRDFYVRQLKDWKGSAEIEQMSPTAMAAYGRMCGLDTGPRARSQRRPHRDRLLPRQRRQLRPSDPRGFPTRPPSPAHTASCKRLDRVATGGRSLPDDGIRQ